VALANTVARIAHPHTTLINDPAVIVNLQQIIAHEDVALLVVGLPRGLSGQHTDQTRAVEEFVLDLKQHVDLPVYWQDEALTSRKAEEELSKRGKPFAKGDIDALAATYILEDFMRDHPEIRA
jgi:putative Holliday junction resolvase